MSWLSAAGSGIIGTAVSTLAGHWSAKQNAKISRDQWNYMQSNAHQLEVKDLRNAGLNPILSASNSQMASMPQVSDNGAAGASANILSSALQANVARENAKLQAETEGQHIDNERKRLELDKERYSFQNRLDASQISLNENLGKYTTSKMLNETQLNLANIDRIRNDIEIANKKLPYEIDNIVANTQNARATADYMLSMVKLNASKVKLTDKQREQIESDLNDPKKLMDKQFWENVFHSNEEKFKLLRASYERGLSNDVYFNFYANSQGSGLQDANDLATIGSRLKYLIK
nr:MAG TPA: minor capsid protein [Microviridae sp.]